MRPIHKIGVLFDDNQDDGGFMDVYGPMPVSSGTVVHAPQTFMLEHQINHPLADAQLPGHRMERNGDEVCHVFLENTIIQDGDRILTIKLVEDNLAQDGMGLDGLYYISPLSVLLVMKPSGETTMMPGYSFVRRIPEAQVADAGFSGDDYGFIPSIGIVTHTGTDDHGNFPYHKGDIVLHQGMAGQPHKLPDGTIHELLPHGIVFCVIEPESMGGTRHGSD